MAEIQARQTTSYSSHRAAREKLESQFVEEVLSVDRVSRTVAGGRRRRSRALVVLGDLRGRVGFGVGKAGDVARAIEKANKAAEKSMISIGQSSKGLPSSVRAKFGASSVLIRPAPRGTGILAGGPVRKILELAGISDATAKLLGSSNKINVVKVVFLALGQLQRNHPEPEIKKPTKTGGLAKIEESEEPKEA